MLEKLLATVADRMTRYWASRDPALVLGDDALSEAARLWEAASRFGDREQVAAASYELGGLHYVR